METSQNQNKPQDNEINTAQWKQATMKTSFNTRTLAHYNGNKPQHSKIITRKLKKLQNNKNRTTQWKQATTQQN